MSVSPGAFMQGLHAAADILVVSIIALQYATVLGILVANDGKTRSIVFYFSDASNYFQPHHA